MDQATESGQTSRHVELNLLNKNFDQNRHTDKIERYDCDCEYRDRAQVVILIGMPFFIFNLNESYKMYELMCKRIPQRCYWSVCACAWAIIIRLLFFPPFLSLRFNGTISTVCLLSSRPKRFVPSHLFVFLLFWDLMMWRFWLTFCLLIVVDKPIFESLTHWKSFIFIISISIFGLNKFKWNFDFLSLSLSYFLCLKFDI